MNASHADVNGTRAGAYGRHVAKVALDERAPAHETSTTSSSPFLQRRS